MKHSYPQFHVKLIFKQARLGKSSVIVDKSQTDLDFKA